MRELLRYWTTLEGTVSRRRYLRHGAALVVLKYGIDALAIWFGAGTVWTPLDYLQPVPTLVGGDLGQAASWLAPLLAAWTLPFLWIGVTMTTRRLVDAGRSTWWSLLFFVPVAGYVLIAVLLVLPGAGHPRPYRAQPSPRRDRGPRRLSSIAAGSAAGLMMFWLGVLAIESYGLALFMGTPFAMGLLAGYVLNRQHPATMGDTDGVVAVTLVVVAVAAFVLGWEGAVCLMMVAPLALILALMGGRVGRFIAFTGERPVPGVALLLVALPTGAGLEAGDHATALREVRSAVVVDATPAEVWEEVIAFSPIPEPRGLLFRLGLAYPTRAEIEGSGVGAVRYCVFSTGAFVEPVTAWEPGVRLAFDVVESPPPLRELSFRDVAPPHLEGYLQPRRGEFRLVALPDGRTRLEGSTWYEQRLRPVAYWALFSDRIIARIHHRVLDHIKGSFDAAS